MVAGQAPDAGVPGRDVDGHARHGAIQTYRTRDRGAARSAVLEYLDTVGAPAPADTVIEWGRDRHPIPELRRARRPDTGTSGGKRSRSSLAAATPRTDHPARQLAHPARGRRTAKPRGFAISCSALDRSRRTHRPSAQRNTRAVGTVATTPRRIDEDAAMRRPAGAGVAATPRPRSRRVARTREPRGPATPGSVGHEKPGGRLLERTRTCCRTKSRPRPTSRTRSRTVTHFGSHLAVTRQKPENPDTPLALKLNFRRDEIDFRP